MNGTDLNYPVVWKILVLEIAPQSVGEIDQPLAPCIVPPILLEEVLRHFMWVIPSFSWFFGSKRWLALGFLNRQQYHSLVFPTTLR